MGDRQMGIHPDLHQPVWATKARREDMTKETQDLVRMATWIDRDVMKQIRLRAAIDGRTIRCIVEESFTDWLVTNPVDQEALQSAVR